MTQMRNLLKQELRSWLQYFVLALFAAMWAYLVMIFSLYPPSEGEDINWAGVFRKMWSIYLVPWLQVFLALSALRFAFVGILHRKKFKKVTGLNR